MSMHIDLSPEGIRIVFGGPEVLLTVRRNIAVPRPDVVSIDLVARSVAPRGRWRSPGLGAVPGLATIGSYWDRRVGWTFWRVYRAQQVVVITVQGHRFQQLVLQADPQLHQQLLSWRAAIT